MVQQNTERKHEMELSESNQIKIKIKSNQIKSKIKLKTRLLVKTRFKRVFQAVDEFVYFGITVVNVIFSFFYNVLTATRNVYDWSILYLFYT